MTNETVELIIMITGSINAVLLPVAILFLRRAAAAGAKALNVEVSASFLTALEKLAEHGVRYAEEQLSKYLKSLVLEGPTSGEEKKLVAIAAMRKQAPPGMKISDEQAEIAVEAVLQKLRPSMRPPPVPGAPGSLPPLSAPLLSYGSASAAPVAKGAHE